MSEPERKRGPSNAQIITFIVILSFICALILSVLASALEQSKETAKELDRSQQMLIAARILTHEGYFQMKNDQDEYVPAKFKDGMLVPGSKEDIATSAEILEIYQNRLVPRFVNDQGELSTPKEAGIDIPEYLANFKKVGYYKQPQKLLFEILPNKKPNELKDAEPTGYVIPVNGFGLWDAIYGFIAIAPDGVTVIGISWYEQKETPGLGANIADASWQDQFHGKKIIQANAAGEYSLKTAPIGITVVKGTVDVALGDSPKATSAVDGMAGATLTGNGVQKAYNEVLAAYRPFFIKVSEQQKQNNNS